MELKQIRRYEDISLLILLIVPYGIETWYCSICRKWRYLLIVPYGIETLYGETLFLSQVSFNRTLWN